MSLEKCINEIVSLIETTGVWRQSGGRQPEPEGWGISKMFPAASRPVSEKVITLINDFVRSPKWGY